MLELEHEKPDPLDLIATEFIQLVRTGKHPSVSEYAKRYPEFAGEIAEMFPTIASMETVRSHTLSGCSPQADSELPKLERLGDYRIVKEIGRGGMGIVFLAVQETLERQVAVKVLPGQCLLDEKRLLRFLRESKTAASLHHTNIVPVFGVGQENGHHYYVMQYIEGVGIDQVLVSWTGDKPKVDHPERAQHLIDRVSNGTLWQELSNTESTSESVGTRKINSSQQAFWSNVARIGIQAADALNYAHQHGVVHRDIKPGNLLIDYSGNIWIADFGLARATEQNNISLTGEVLGTLRYMAPEQRSGEADARSDIYALGLTLYEVVAKQACREKTNLLPKQFGNGNVVDELPRLRSLDKAIPRDLETIIAKASATAPLQRYQSANELSDDFARFLSGQPIKARRMSSIERLARWSSRNPVSATIGASSLLILILVACFASFAYMREAHHRQRFESMSNISTEILDKIYGEFAPRRLPPDGIVGSPAESSFAGATIEQMPSTETIAVLENLLLYYDQIASQNQGEKSVVFKAAEANHRIGNMQRLLGNFDAAESAFRRAIELCGQANSSNIQSPKIKHLISASWNELGQTHEASGRSKDARIAHTNALIELETLVKNDRDSAQLQFERAKTLYLLDRYGFHQSIENLSTVAAGSRTQNAIEILESLVNEFPTPEFRVLLARCYRRMSNYESAGLPNESDRQARQVFTTLVTQFPDISEYRFELAQTLNSCRMENLVKDEPEMVIERLDKARMIVDGLVRDFAQIPHYRQLQVTTNRQMSFVFQQLEKPEQAKILLAEAIVNQKALLSKFTGATHQHILLAKLRLDLANVQFKQERLDPCFSTLITMRDELLPIVKNQTADAPVNLGSIHKGLKDLADLFESQMEPAGAQQIRELGSSLSKTEDQMKQENGG